MIRVNNIGFGGTSTLLFPAALLLILLGILCVLVLPRRYATAAFLLTVFIVPMSQRLVAGGLDFTASRLLIIAALPRLMGSPKRTAASAEFGPSITRAWICFWASSSIVFVLQWSTFGAVVNQLGALVDSVGGFFVMRSLIRDRDDVRSALKVLGGICCFFACTMLYERATMHNPLALLGASEPWLRDGKVRAVATFAHAILAGTFGATLFPIFFGYLRRQPGHAAMGVVFSGAAATMALTSFSSSSTLSLMMAIVALLMWPLRHQTRTIKYSIIMTLVALHIVMKAPVWALIQRVNVGGGTGFHRFQLVDQTIRHFWDWVLIGTKSYGLWGYDMWDLANTYVAAALTGGLSTLILLFVLLRRVFVALSLLRARVAGYLPSEKAAWAFTAATLAHAVAFFGISYGDQTKVLWMVFLVMVVAITTDPSTMARPEAPDVNRLEEPFPDRSTRDWDFDHLPRPVAGF